LSGVIVPDAGTIEIDGEEVRFRNALDARAAGIETVFQDLAVVPALDISSNMYLGREVRRPGLRGSVLRMLDKRAMRAASAETFADLGIRIKHVAQTVETL